MPFDFEPLLGRIDNLQQGIKLEILHETAEIVGEFCRQLEAHEIAPVLAPPIEGLTKAAQTSGRMITYGGLRAFLHSPAFAALARSADPIGSRLHFRQLLTVLQELVRQVRWNTIDEVQTYRINSLLNRVDIHL